EVGLREGLGAAPPSLGRSAKVRADVHFHCNIVFRLVETFPGCKQESKGVAAFRAFLWCSPESPHAAKGKAVAAIRWSLPRLFARGHETNCQGLCCNTLRH